ncbi:MAG: hypothetical protein Tsb005_08420 [Gammaproteobacteria bacterium]
MQGGHLAAAYVARGEEAAFTELRHALLALAEWVQRPALELYAVLASQALTQVTDWIDAMLQQPLTHVRELPVAILAQAITAMTLYAQVHQHSQPGPLQDIAEHGLTAMTYLLEVYGVSQQVVLAHALGDFGLFNDSFNDFFVTFGCKQLIRIR